MRRALLLLVCALVVTGVAVAGGLLLTDARSPGTPPPPAATPLSRLEPRDVAVARAAFCDDVPAAWVVDALGAAPLTARGWADGDTLPAATGVRDVAHEYGCRWAAGGTAVEGWVFAPPVAPARARALVRTARTAAGCTPVADAAPLGEPSVAVSCRSGDRATTTYAGLLGDAWLTCRVSTSVGRAAELAELADRWCGMLLESAAG